MVQAELAQITTTTAAATEAADEKAIQEIIRQLPDGFETLDRIVREKLAALIVGTLADQEGMTEEQALREDNNTQQAQIVEQQDQIEALMLQVKVSQKRPAASNWRCC